MAVAGGIGVGLVIGWVAGQITARTLRPRVAIPAASFATVLAGGAVGLLSSDEAVAGYALAVVSSTPLAVVWLRWLEGRAKVSW